MKKYFVYMFLIVFLFGYRLAHARLEGQYRIVFLQNVVPHCMDRERNSKTFNKQKAYQWCTCKFSLIADVLTLQDFVNLNQGIPFPPHVESIAESASVSCVAKVLN